MHSHVSQDTPDHHDPQLFATDTEGVLLGTSVNKVVGHEEAPGSRRLLTLALVAG